MMKTNHAERSSQHSAYSKIHSTILQIPDQKQIKILTKRRYHISRFKSSGETLCMRLEKAAHGLLTRQ